MVSHFLIQISRELEEIHYYWFNKNIRRITCNLISIDNIEIICVPVGNTFMYLHTQPETP